MNPRPSDYKAQPRGFYRLLRLTVSPSETAVYGPLASRSITPDFYRFLPRVPKKVTIVGFSRQKKGGQRPAGGSPIEHSAAREHNGWPRRIEALWMLIG